MIKNGEALWYRLGLRRKIIDIPVRVLGFIAGLFFLNCSIATSLCYLYFGYHNAEDFVGYCILWPRDSTVWSANYSESSFAKILPGMSEQEVEKILGPPLLKGGAIWHYACGDKECHSLQANFHRRRILFSKQGTVEYTDKEYWTS